MPTWLIHHGVVFWILKFRFNCHCVYVICVRGDDDYYGQIGLIVSTLPYSQLNRQNNVPLVLKVFMWNLIHVRPAAVDWIKGCGIASMHNIWLNKLGGYRSRQKRKKMPFWKKNVWRKRRKFEFTWHRCVSATNEFSIEWVHRIENYNNNNRINSTSNLTIDQYSLYSYVDQFNVTSFKRSNFKKKLSMLNMQKRERKIIESKHVWC